MQAAEEVTGFDPQVGDEVCDCRYRHLRITERDGDDLVLENGSHCSLKHCCDPPDHEWPHPDLTGCFLFG